MDVRLFLRSSGGLHLTTQGRELQQQVGAIGLQFQDLQTAIQGLDRQPAGHVRLVSSEGLLVENLLAHLSVFNAQYPQIHLSILSTGGPSDIALGQADLALEATNQPPETLVGRRLSALAVAVYARTELAQEIDEMAAGSPLHWVNWHGRGELAAYCQSLQGQHFTNADMRLTSDALATCHAAIQSGLGAGLLPCYLGAADATLQRLSRMPVTQGPALWLLSHPDQRGAARINAVVDLVRSVVSRQQQVLSGEQW